MIQRDKARKEDEKDPRPMHPEGLRRCRPRLRAEGKGKSQDDCRFLGFRQSEGHEEEDGNRECRYCRGGDFLGDQREMNPRCGCRALCLEERDRDDIKGGDKEAGGNRIRRDISVGRLLKKVWYHVIG